MERHLTKIVATVGPACQSEKTIGELILAGVNIFRFNFKHNTLDWHDRMIQKVNRVAMHLGARVGTLIDLQGPEIRIKLPKEKILVKKGQIIPFFTITHPQLIPLLKTGQKIIVDDGKFKFVFNKKSRNNFLISESDGFVLNKKTLNIPGLNFPLPVLIDRDFQGLHLAARNQVDYVALSFVRSADDISILRREIKKFKLDTSVIAKIETNMALKNLDKILTVSDGIMVARGDLGVEIPLEEVPYQQKIIIKKCILKGIPVITATQMLESMITAPIPTRAEISDIANATYDLTDAVMLSGETATGKYPVQAVEIMRKTLIFNEKKNLVDSRLRFNFNVEEEYEFLAEAAYGLYRSISQKKRTFAGFIVFTTNGQAIRALARYRPLFPIFAFMSDSRIADQLAASFGVNAIILQEQNLEKAFAFLKKANYLKKGGDIFIILYPTSQKGTRVLGISHIN
ncbi:pyruvate kinase [Candidatus Roizmanbacteria bacterium RIFCSPHIGHO2_02_FULL_37_15]|nr:MAG: pyruvate kinase [Candidatus Roizmanbacteria bacterium RIFCSPHIGHO2_01_FULL_37_16b]OGK20782.1 MAG: pyruvate kinase [Candidatus Roizmanbacteria bacterium RIFCSPHIGHO2_02_FULL_37_15]